MLIALATVTAVALAVQLAALGSMGRRRPIGDEVEYVERGAASDPHAPGLFLRPPLLPWLARLAGRGASGEAAAARLRRALAGVSVLTVAVTGAAGWRLGGTAVALGAGLLLALLPERILLGCHVWPDALLALWLAGLALVLTFPPSPAAALSAGAVATLGVLTRIDFAAAAALLTLAWVDLHGSLDGVSAAALLAPPLVALGLLTARNRRRYGIALPDTTWAFNLMVARSEAELTEKRRFAIERAVADAVAPWQRLAPARYTRAGLSALWAVARSPRRLARGIVRRALTLAGPDTFAREKLLPADAAYPELGGRARRAWDAALTAGFPLVVAVLGVASAVALRAPASFAWPFAGLAAAAVLFHARTRYRLALMPALALLLADATASALEVLDGRPAAAAAAVAAACVLFGALVRIRAGVELEGSGKLPGVR